MTMLRTLILVTLTVVALAVEGRTLKQQSSLRVEVYSEEGL
jgi:hypothetical protein